MGRGRRRNFGSISFVGSSHVRLDRFSDESTVCVLAFFIATAVAMERHCCVCFLFFLFPSVGGRKYEFLSLYCSVWAILRCTTPTACGSYTSTVRWLYIEKYIFFPTVLLLGLYDLMESKSSLPTPRQPG